MLETSARLLRLLALFQAQRYWSGGDLSGRLEVTARTLRRDVDRLRSLGYPVHSSSGTAGGYQLGAGATLPPLLLDDEEAVAVAVGLRTAAGGTVEGISAGRWEEASVRALTKLEQLLPARLRRRVSALNSFILPLAAAGPSVNADTLVAIASACRDSEHLRFNYEGRDGSVSRREVEPHRLVHTGRRWYLVAWDTARKDWRTFRVDRIEGRLSTAARFAPRTPPDGDFAAYVSRSVTYPLEPVQGVVKLFAPAGAVAQRIPPRAGILEDSGDGTCVLRAGACSFEALAICLAATGFDFEVREPVELIARVRALAERFGRACRNDSGG